MCYVAAASEGGANVFDVKCLTLHLCWSGCV